MTTTLGPGKERNLARTTLFIALVTLLPQVNAACSRLTIRLALHAIKDLLGHEDEAVVHVRIGLCACLNEVHLVLFCKALALHELHAALRLQIALVADEKLVYELRGEPIDFRHPIAYVLEGFVICDVVNKDDAMCSSVVTRCNRPEAL